MGLLMTQVVLGGQTWKGAWVTVSPGQSLWEIASVHYPQTDPRQGVAEIEQANHLGSSGYVYPGERLLLPAS